MIGWSPPWEGSSSESSYMSSFQRKHRRAWHSLSFLVSYLLLSKSYSFILHETETLFHKASQGKGFFASECKVWGLFIRLEACCWPRLWPRNESNRIPRAGDATHMCSPSIRVFGFSSVAKQTLGLGVDSHHSTTQEVEAEGWGDLKKEVRKKKEKKRNEIKVILSYSVISSPVEDARDPVSKENRKGSLPPS